MLFSIGKEREALEVSVEELVNIDVKKLILSYIKELRSCRIILNRRAVLYNVNILEDNRLELRLADECENGACGVVVVTNLVRVIVTAHINLTFVINNGDTVSAG